MRPRDYFATVSPTYIENWAPALYSLSIPQAAIRMTLDEACALGSSIEGFGKWFWNRQEVSLEPLKQRIGMVLRRFPDGVFVRLGSRSAKDSHYALRRGLRVASAEAAMKVLTGGSRRIATDLLFALRNAYEPSIYVRQWMDILPWSEFRCFMQNRRLVGISQYDCKNLGCCAEIKEMASQIRSAVEEFFEQFRLVSHLDSVVFDVFLATKDGKLASPLAVRLLELNPVGPPTEPCLFSWSDSGDLDGTFRFL